MDEEATLFRILGVVLVVVLIGYSVFAGRLLFGILAALALVGVGLAYRLVRALERITAALEADARSLEGRVGPDAGDEPHPGWDRLEEGEEDRLGERNRN